MDHVLTEHGLRLTYLCDPHAIDDLDQDRILNDLSDDMPDDDPLPWPSRYTLSDYDHLVLVTDQVSGCYLGFLGANDGNTTREDFLLLETAFVAPPARGQNLMRRMIALAMLRIGGMRAVPSVIVACTHDPVCYRILRETARRFTGAVFFPDPDSVAINFHTATLAQRIARELGPNHRFQIATGTICGGMMVTAGAGHYRPLVRDPQFDRMFGQWMQPADRMLAMLDLRGEDEITILGDARRLYRSR
ncbi:MAG: hypothetical protein WDN25_09225 [Acetobacteraceae bacterium]